LLKVRFTENIEIWPEPINTLNIDAAFGRVITPMGSSGSVEELRRLTVSAGLPGLKLQISGYYKYLFTLVEFYAFSTTIIFVIMDSYQHH